MGIDSSTKATSQTSSGVQTVAGTSVVPPSGLGTDVIDLFYLHQLDDASLLSSETAAVAEQLDLRNAIHIGHSTGGGEVARYVARHGQPSGRAAKAERTS